MQERTKEPGAALEQYYSTHQVAEALNLDDLTVLRMIRAGEIAAFRIHGKSGEYRIARTDVEAYISRMKAHAAQENGAPLDSAT